MSLKTHLGNYMCQCVWNSMAKSLFKNYAVKTCSPYHKVTWQLKSKQFCFAWYYDGEHEYLSNSHKHGNKS